MINTGTEMYPVIEGLGDIVQETREWYRSLGYRIGGTIYSVVKATDSMTGLVHSIANSVNLEMLISKKVKCVIEDIPAIAFVENEGADTVVHIGSWLYNRERLEEWYPPVAGMNNTEMLMFALGAINGAVALDLLAKTTAKNRTNTLEQVTQNIFGLYREKEYTYVLGEGVAYRDARRADDEKLIFMSALIHDVISMKAVLHKSREEVGWVIFPILLFRTFYSDAYAKKARENIEKEDSLDNFFSALLPLRCFSSGGAEILNVESSTGINFVKVLLTSVYESFNDCDRNSVTADARDVISGPVAMRYLKYISIPPEEAGKDDKGEGDGEDKQDDKGGGGGGGETQQNQNNNNEQNQDDKLQDRHSPFGGMKPPDPTTPINQDMRDREYKTEELNRRSKNTKIRRVSEGERDFTEKFLRRVFNTEEIDYENKSPVIYPLVYAKNMDEYFTATGLNRNYKNERGAEAISRIYNAVEKTPLRNLFLSRTMDIEKSQPARSGIALIPTRIVNIFTDEKVFSPLPEEDMERESEVNILIDASGSMTGYYNFNGEWVDEFGRTHNYFTCEFIELVTAIGQALLEGFTLANIHCTVFAHTTFDNSNYDEYPVVVRIADSETHDKKKAFGMSTAIHNQNNADGYAIEEMANHFTSDGKDRGKTLIVLSDGRPASKAYTGRHSGIEHTKRMVDQLREQENVQVYSISLDHDVVKYNDTIYGKENNFFPGEDEKINANTVIRNIVKLVSANSSRSANNVLTQG